MHQNAAFHAIRGALLRMLPDLAETVEGRVKIERTARNIMKTLGEEGLRFVGAKGDWSRPVELNRRRNAGLESQPREKASAEF